MESRKLTGLKKRQQIDKANKTMFVWVAVASVVVAFALVAAQFMFKQAAFNQKIISAKSETRETLESNLKTADALKEEVNKLIANSALSSSKPKSSSAPGAPAAKSNNLQVVLDALPTENDPAALTASLQHAVLDQSGVSIERLSATSGDIIGENIAVAANDQPVEMPFNMVINGNYEQIKRAFTDMERVIRPMTIKTITIQGSDNQLRATIDGVTYYLPAKTVDLTTETIKP